MAKKKATGFTATFHVAKMVEVAIVAGSLEDAVNVARSVKVDDIWDGEILDYTITLQGVSEPDKWSVE